MLEEQFHQEMLEIYRTAQRDCNYNANRFLHMVGVQGGLATAKQLLNAPKPSDGYFALAQHKRLDLTVEALALRSPWSTLFTEQELRNARKRLPPDYPTT